jgi:hypothetical protein
MGTSGTGHSGARLSSPAHQAPETPPYGGDTKISKRRFGFKGGRKNFPGRVEPKLLASLGMAAKTGGAAPFFKGLPGYP